LIRHRGHHDWCHMRSRKLLPFRSTCFYCFYRVSCCPIICVSLFHVLSFGLITWYLYIFYHLLGSWIHKQLLIVERFAYDVILDNMTEKTSENFKSIRKWDCISRNWQLVYIDLYVFGKLITQL